MLDQQDQCADGGLLPAYQVVGPRGYGTGSTREDNNMKRKIATMATVVALGIGGALAQPATATPEGCPGDRADQSPAAGNIPPVAQAHQKTACSHRP